jgi:hypothetical protein
VWVRTAISCRASLRQILDGRLGVYRARNQRLDKQAMGVRVRHLVRVICDFKINFYWLAHHAIAAIHGRHRVGKSRRMSA